MKLSELFADLPVTMLRRVGDVPEPGSPVVAAVGAQAAGAPTPVDPVTQPLGVVVLDDGRTAFKVPGDRAMGPMTLVYRPPGAEADIELALTPHTEDGRQFFTAVVEARPTGPSTASASPRPCCRRAPTWPCPRCPTRGRPSPPGRSTGSGARWWSTCAG